MTLIDYSPRQAQIEVTEELNQGLSEYDRMLLVASTAFGKTVFAANHIAENIHTLYPGFKPHLNRNGWKCPVENPKSAPPQILFVVHRDKLVKQTLAKFKAVFRSRYTHRHLFNENHLWDAVTVIKGSQRYEWFKPIVVVSQQTLERRLDEYLSKGIINPKFIYFDECHTTATSPSGQNLVEKTRGTWEKIIGLTATPFWRDTQKVAGDFFDWAVCSRSFSELVESGELCRLLYFEPDYPEKVFEEFLDPFTKQVKTREVRCKYESEIELDYVVDKWFQNECERLKTIVFAKKVEHGENIKERFRLRGVKAEIISYKIPEKERPQIFQGFEEGDTQVLISIDSLGVGYDYQGIQCVLLLRETESLALHWQQMGRGARTMKTATWEKPWCKVFDFVGNIKRHGDFGIPDMVKLTPELVMGRIQPKKRKGSAPTKMCPECEFVNFAGSRICLNPHKHSGEESTEKKTSENAHEFVCNYEFPLKTRIGGLSIVPGEIHQLFIPEQTMEEEDIVRYFRSLRMKRWARKQNPNAALDDYAQSEIGQRLELPSLSDPVALRDYTIGSLTGKPNSVSTAKKLLSTMLKLRKERPLRWKDAVIYSVIFLEFEDAVANEVNNDFITRKMTDIDRLILELDIG